MIMLKAALLFVACKAYSAFVHEIFAEFYFIIII